MPEIVVEISSFWFYKDNTRFQKDMLENFFMWINASTNSLLTKFLHPRFRSHFLSTQFSFIQQFQETIFPWNYRRFYTVGRAQQWKTTTFVSNFISVLYDINWAFVVEILRIILVLYQDGNQLNLHIDKNTLHIYIHCKEENMVLIWKNITSFVL